MGKSTIRTQNLFSENENTQISGLLDQIEKGDIPTEILIKQMFKMLIEQNYKIDSLNQKLVPMIDISRKISEIHSLHFPKDAFEKEKNLTEKFLAEILLGIPRKRIK